MGAIEERCGNCGEPVTQPGLCPWCVERLCVECERVVLAQPGCVCIGCVESYAHSMCERDRVMTDWELAQVRR